MAWSAFPVGNAQQVTRRVTQVAHGFTIGQYGLILTFDGSDYVPAQGDSQANSNVVGMLTKVLDVDTFEYTITGYVSALTYQAPYVAGTLYWLSPTNPGELTDTKPTTIGQYLSPLFIATGNAEGVFVANVGEIIDSLDQFNTIVTALDMQTQAGVRYVANDGAQLTFNLPVNAVVGDTVGFGSINTGGFKVTQNLNQYVDFNGTTSTISTGEVELTSLHGGFQVINTVVDDGWLAQAITGLYNVT